MIRQKENLISSWKNIAKYLNCHTKTCYRWHKKYEMPVHKVDETSGSTVFAYKEELDQWLKKRCDNNHEFKTEFIDGADEKIGLRSGEEKKSIARKYLFLLLIILLPVIIYLLAIKSNDNSPYDFQIKGSKLIILSESGKKLWSKDFDIPNLVSEKEYRDHFQIKKQFINYALRRKLIFFPHIIIKDINNDKMPEVLFSIQTNDEKGEGLLICYDFEGQELWNYKAGKKMNFNGMEYSGDYRLHGVDIFDFDKDGNSEILVISRHKIDFPCQILLLNNKGKIKGEYWNSGYIIDYTVVDLNQDSKEELLFAGTNNEYEKGCLLVFDSDSISGRSPQSGKWKCDNIKKRGSEKYYLLFPRTGVDKQLSLIEWLDSITIMKNRRLSCQALYSTIIFELDYNLVVDIVTLSNNFLLMHRLLRKEGKISSGINDQYKERLKQRILYYNGNDWVSKPSMSNPW